jgi:hypothetical protein
MPFAFLIAGIVLAVSGVRGTTGDLTQLVKGDFQGKNNFAYWLASILVIGAIGYIEEFKPLSRMFLVLVVVVLFLSNRGFFAAFMQQAFTSTSTIPIASTRTGSDTSNGAGTPIGGSEGNATGAPFSIPIIHPLG